MKLEGEEYFNNIERVIEDYMEEFKKVYINTLTTHNRKATGNLINSIKTFVKKGDKTYEVWLDVADYYYYVDKGRKAGKFPPPKKILQWIKAKPILPRPDSNGKLPTEKQLAFLIGRKIAREGWKGTNDLAHTLEEVNSKYLPLLQEALESDWYEYSLTILDEIGKIRV